MRFKRANLNKEDVFACLRGRGGSVISFKELADRLRLKPSEKRALKRTLNNLIASGELERVRRNKYFIAAAPQLVRGRFEAHKDGFGFVVPQAGLGGDIYIRMENRFDAMHGDLVQVALEPERKRGGLREGRIARVLERAAKIVVGRYERVAAACFLHPLDPRFGQTMLVSPKSASGAKSGHFVAAEIVRYPSLGRLAEARVLKVIGDPSEPGVFLHVVLDKYSIDREFSPQAIAESEEVARGIEKRHLEGRLNLRRLAAFTIDPDDAKDFDDAVSIRRVAPGLLRVGVHIADVSHYVRQDGAIDLEARKRSTSVYFPGYFVPMLPPRLSSDICSLKEGEERLTLSIFMDFDPKGELKGYRFAPSVIKSKARLTYKEAAAIIEPDAQGLSAKHARLRKRLRAMAKLASALRQKRIAKGSLDFDLPEADIVLGDDGRPEDVAKIERTAAHTIIEEFMLAANRLVADHLQKSGFPSIFRVHEKPDPAKIAYFARLVSSFGYKIKAAHRGATSRALQKVLEEAKGKPEARLINSLLLRSMKQARYAASNLGHYGLGFKIYTHFTSPIRRYPDLVVHRLLKRALSNAMPSPKWKLKTHKELEAIAYHSSEKERSAVEAEREMTNIKKAQFMADKVGEHYCGFISRVTKYGFNVELDDFFVEGFLPIANLGDDYYRLADNGLALAGRRSGTVYRLGDPIRVRVNRVNIERGEIELEVRNS